jgi:hypothetical protein
MRTSIFVIRDSLRSQGLAYCLYRALQPVVNLRCLAFAQAARPAVPLITNLLGESTMSKTHKDLVQFKAKQPTTTPKPRKHGARYKREQVQKREWKSGLEYRLGRDD